MLRGAERWIGGYAASVLRRHRAHDVRHLLFCIADHYEPFERTVMPSGEVTGGRTLAEACAGIRDWCAAYTGMASGLADSDGRPPQHTFFYPWDEYAPDCLDLLGDFCKRGLGEVELHLHHRHDTAEGLRGKLSACRDAYAGRHGFLGRMTGDGSARYAFVHGNWALCNSRPDGDWCGVDQELSVLRETGCYADFTFPSAPSPTQPRFVNAPYYGGDPEEGGHGHRFLHRVRVDRPGVQSGGGGLLFIPGPLGLNWSSRKFGILPRVENGEISAIHPATVGRLALWMRLQVAVEGRPDWLVVKLHTHGMSTRSRAGVLGPAMRRFHEELCGRCSESKGRLLLHYVTARELYNIVKAAESGADGNPGAYRDFVIKPPPCRRS